MKVWSKVKEGRAGIVLSLCFSFLVMIYAPLEMFFYNTDDFWFNFTTIFPVCFTLFFLLWMIGSLFFVLLNTLNRQIYYIGFFGTFVALVSTYIQGTFLVDNLPPMDGTDIDWEQYHIENYETIILWFVVLICCLLLIKFGKISFFLKLTEGISVFLFLILSVSIIFSGIMTSGYKNKDILVATDKDEFEFSRDTNFLIFVLDAVDAGTVTQILETDEESREVFEDFTYFDNVVCTYPFTKYSMPFILSGKWYKNEEPPMEYFRDAIQDSPLIQEIESQYKMEIYSDSIPVVAEENENRFANMISDYGYVASYKQFVKGVVKLAGIRYAPYPLKKICYNVLERFEQARGIEASIDDEQVYTWNNKELCQRIKDEAVSYTSSKVFKLEHVQGAHVPYQYNKNVEKIENGTYLGNVEASITIASRYLDQLKKYNVYDNSVIIIMADHGYNVEGLEGRQNPILFIKGLEERHAMKTSSIPVSYDDLQDAYQLLIKGESSDNIFPWEENQIRHRTYILYKYEEEEKMYEYTTDGKATETEKMKPTGREFFR